MTKVTIKKFGVSDTIRKLIDFNINHHGDTLEDMYNYQSPFTKDYPMREYLTKSEPTQAMKQIFEIGFDGIILDALKRRAASLGTTPEQLIRMFVLEDGGIADMIERIVEDGAEPIIIDTKTGWGLTQKQLESWATIMNMSEPAVKELIGYAEIYNSIPAPDIEGFCIPRTYKQSK